MTDSVFQQGVVLADPRGYYDPRDISPQRQSGDPLTLRGTDHSPVLDSRTGKTRHCRNTRPVYENGVLVRWTYA